MSDGSASGIGPVSVRYAAQIRELLYAQAVHRMVADEEATRARLEAERNARSDTTAKKQAADPLDVKIQTPQSYEPSPTKQPDASAGGSAVATGHLVDIQA